MVLGTVFPDLKIAAVGAKNEVGSQLARSFGFRKICNSKKFTSLH